MINEWFQALPAVTSVQVRVGHNSISHRNHTMSSSIPAETEIDASQIDCDPGYCDTDDGYNEPDMTRVVHTVKEADGGFVQYVDTVPTRTLKASPEFNYVDMDPTLRKILFDKYIKFGGGGDTPMQKVPMTEMVRIKMLNDYILHLKRNISKKE